MDSLTTTRIRPPVWLRAVLLGALLLVPVGVLLDGDPNARAWGLLPFLFVGAIVVPIACSSHWVEADGDALRLRFWPLANRRVAFADITSWSISDDVVSTWQFGGSGLRLASGGTLAFVHRRGRLLTVEATGRRRYAVSLAEADVAGLDAVLRRRVPAAG